MRLHVHWNSRWVNSSALGRINIVLRALNLVPAELLLSTCRPPQQSQRQAITEWHSVYVALDGKLMAVPIEFDATGKTVEAGTPVALFDTACRGAVRSN